MSNANDFELSEGDKLNPLWLRLKEHLQMRLVEARGKNDNEALDATGTAALRGQIKLLKVLIGLGDERPIVEVNRD